MLGLNPSEFQQKTADYKIHPEISFCHYCFLFCVHTGHSVSDKNLFLFLTKYDPRQTYLPLTKQFFNHLVATYTNFVTYIYAAKLNSLIHRRLRHIFQCRLLIPCYSIPIHICYQPYRSLFAIHVT